MAYGCFKDLSRRAASDRILRDKAFNIAKYLKYHGYQRGLPSMIYKFVDQKTPGSGIKNENISNKELAEDLHKPIIKTFKKRKVHSHFMDNIWSANLADMPLISKFSERIHFLLCLTDIYDKHAWIIHLKDRKKNYNY